MKRLISHLIFSGACLSVSAQKLTIDSAVMLALGKHPAIAASHAEIDKQRALKRAAIDIPQTDVAWMRGQFNSIVTDDNITITQSIPFPLTIARQRKLADELIVSATWQEQVTKNELAYRVRQAFNLLTYLKAKRDILQRQDSLYSSLLRAADLQYKTGEVPLMTRTLAETQRMETGNELEKNRIDIERARTRLQMLCQTPINEIAGTLEGLFDDTQVASMIRRNPSQLLYEQNIQVAFQERKFEASRALPEMRISYFNQTLIGIQNVNGQDLYFDASDRFDGFQFGLSIPLWFAGNINRVKAAKQSEEAMRELADANRLEIASELNTAQQERTKNEGSLTYYRAHGLPTAARLRAQANTAFRNGEIDYHTLLLTLRQALAIDDGYLRAQYDYNESLITILYLNGNN